MPRKTLPALLGAILLMSAHTVSALIITPSDQSWFKDDGQNNSVENTFTGRDPGGADNNSYFAFDLSSISGAVVSATLTLTPFLYASPDATESFEIYDVSASVSELTTLYGSGNATGLGIFIDLGSGALYGSLVTSGAAVTVSFSAAAISDINSALGGFFSVGLTSTSATGAGFDEGVLWGFEDGLFDSIPTELELVTAPVPEPGSWILLVTGLLLGGFAARRREPLAA